MHTFVEMLKKKIVSLNILLSPEFYNHYLFQFVICLSIIISISTTAYYFNKNQTLAYGDAESHINISKRVVSSITPGFGQLGGNWLPLHHILMIPFVWNDYLWRNGLGGSIISMFSFILSSVLLYKLIELLTESKYFAFFGAILFMTNPNILYLQSTPMGELPLLVTLIGSVYFLTHWVNKKEIHNLIFSAIFAFCGTLIRYDAWFLVVFESFFILLIGLMERCKWKKIEGYMIMFLTISLVGIAFWILWNLLIFNNPFYFLTSPYSAKSQQLAWLSRGQLPSYHNIIKSFTFYIFATIKNGGLLFTILSSIGLIIYTFDIILNKYKRKKLLAGLLLYTPFPFYVVTLYLGISIILTPELLPSTFEFKLFNIRYGLMMIPGMVFITSYLFTYKNNIVRILICLVIIFQFYLFSTTIPTVIEDTIIGLSGRKPGPINDYIAKYYDFGFVMFDDFSRSANPIALNVPMNKIIYVGNHPIWDNALKNPSKYIRWFIVRKDENDVIWNTLKDNKEFIKNYKVVNSSGKTFVYKRYITK